MEVSYTTYLNKVLRQVHPDTGISKSSLLEVNSLIANLAKRIANKSMNLTQQFGKSTITFREIDASIMMILPGELAKHARSEGKKAVQRYNAGQAGTLWATGPQVKPPLQGSTGLTFSVSRTKRFIKSVTNNMRVGVGAAVYLAATLEYISAEIFDLAGNASHDNKKVRISHRHTMLAIGNDKELTKLFEADVLAGGVLPRSIPNSTDSGDL